MTGRREANLEEARREIDDVDTQITALLIKRQGLVLREREAKRSLQLPAWDTARERDVVDRAIRRVAAGGGDPSIGLFVFEAITDAFGRRQEGWRYPKPEDKPPNAPFILGDKAGNFARREGWKAFFEGKPATPPERCGPGATGEDAYLEGWKAAEAWKPKEAKA